MITHGSVSQIVFKLYGVSCAPCSKITCPFCDHKTFCIKKDDTLGKCFHPSCGQFIAARSGTESEVGLLQPVLAKVFGDFHATLLALAEHRNRSAYDYLVEERKIHPQVVSDSLLGVVPEDFDIEDAFDEVEKEGATEEHASVVAGAKEKLDRCLRGHTGWLGFFYTDQHHRIVGIRFRQPYSKNIRYFKPFEAAGLFGLGMFKPDSRPGDTSLNGQLLATEGEFNQLQLQSLLVRYCDATGESWDYVNACAVGGVNNADFHTLAKVAAKPIICYDNDGSGAGFNLVEKARDIASVNAFTTPEVDSDLDDFIRSFGDKYIEAWEALKELISNRESYPKLFSGVASDVFRARQKQGRSDVRREFEINAEVAEMIRSDLADRGRFYWDAQGTYFFQEAEKKLIAIERDNPDCSLLLSNYGLNPTERIHRYVTQDLWITARREGTQGNIHRLAYYDQKVPAVHLFNHSNQIYRIGADSMDLVDNGTDGVLFLSDSRSEPFVIGNHEPTNSPLDKLILSQINFAEDTLTPDERRQILAIWLYSQFFHSVMPTRPILAFIGEKGSGKSITLRKIGMLLYGSSFDVTPLPNKMEDFDAAVTNSAFVAIDNADSKCRWLEDRLATVATGGRIKKRVLYTTNQMVDIPLDCSLAITSRTPHFKRDDVADRLLIMRVDRYSRFKSAGPLLREILDNRNEMMTELAYQVQDVVRALEASKGVDDSSAFRMGDFSDFAIKIGRHAGIEGEIRDIFRKLTHEQSAFTLEGDPLFDLLCEWVETNSGKSVTNAELCQELGQQAERRGTEFYFKGRERSFSQRMTRIRPNLEQFFEITEESGRSRSKHFQFKPKAQEVQI